MNRHGGALRNFKYWSYKFNIDEQTNRAIMKNSTMKLNVRYPPTCLAVRNLFSSKNIMTMLSLSHSLCGGGGVVLALGSGGGRSGGGGGSRGRKVVMGRWWWG